MKTLLYRVLGFFLSFLVFAACASDRDDEPSGLAFEELPVLLAELICAELESCLGPDLLVTWLGEVDCVERPLACQL